MKKITELFAADGRTLTSKTTEEAPDVVATPESADDNKKDKKKSEVEPEKWDHVIYYPDGGGVSVGRGTLYEVANLRTKIHNKIINHWKFGVILAATAALGALCFWLYSSHNNPPPPPVSAAPVAQASAAANKIQEAIDKKALEAVEGMEVKPKGGCNGCSSANTNCNGCPVPAPTAPAPTLKSGNTPDGNAYILNPDGTMTWLPKGPQGAPGKDGVDGKDGKPGQRGKQGEPGKVTVKEVPASDGSTDEDGATDDDN